MEIKLARFVDVAITLYVSLLIYNIDIIYIYIYVAYLEVDMMRAENEG